MRRRDFLALTAGGTAVALPGMAEAAKVKIYKSQKARFKVVQVAGGLAKPWGMAFLPTGELLVTEKDIGRLRVIKNGKLESTPVSGVAPDAAESGLQDVAADPNFASNRRIYLTFIGGSGSQETTHVARAVLNGRQLTGWTVIYRATSAGTLGHHVTATACCRTGTATSSSHWATATSPRWRSGWTIPPARSAASVTTAACLPTTRS
jgi:glucose/arabinose dehydrogenase